MSGNGAKPKAWMPLYIGDWDGDTGHLTNEQDGAYGRLIRWYWRKGPLPDDDTMLASIIRTDVKTWRKLRQILATFFQVEGGVWRHKRVDEELVNWTEKKARATDRARAAADARWDRPTPKKTRTVHAKGNATSMPEALLEQCPSPSPTEVTAQQSAVTLCGTDDAARHDGATTPALRVVEKEPLEVRKAVVASIGRGLPKVIRTPPSETASEMADRLRKAMS